jgi:hypothetical protein
MKIAVPTAKLCLRTQPANVVTTFFVPVYFAGLEPVMMSVDDIVAAARGPPAYA